MAKKNPIRTNNIVDCACVIHSSGYSWTYVEHLYNMLTRNLPQGIRFHVYTEHDRSVPPHMIKHCLTEWPGIAGLKRSWWYKMQLFNPEHHQGNMLYFDLDCVIINDLSWLTALHTDYFWTIRDFRYLQSAGFSGMNSSVMWWNVNKFAHIWHDFEKLNINDVTRRYQGDQDYIWNLHKSVIRFFPEKWIQSYKWEIRDRSELVRINGRFNFDTVKDVQIDKETNVLAFHGSPDPHEVKDPIIVDNWQ